MSAKYVDLSLQLALSLYVLAGMFSVPFHADEAIHLANARAYVVYFVIGEPRSLRVDPPVAIDSDPYNRLLSGTLSAYLTGFVLWHSGSVHLENWTPAWYFPESPVQNRAAGRYPAAEVLRWGRLAAALLTAGGVWVMARLGTRLVGRRAGLLSALVFGLHPVILLNGRRAMQEGALLFFTLLFVWLAIRWVERQDNVAVFAAGLAGGLALASKPSALIAWLGVVLGVTALMGLEEERRRSHFIGLGIMLVTGGLVYLALTPAIWSDPLDRMLLAARLRADVLRGQTAASPDAYEAALQKWAALLTQPFLSELQYYESPAFTADEGIAQEIARYEASFLRGAAVPLWIGLPLVGLGAARLTRGAFKSRQPAAIMVWAWTAVTLIAVGQAVPLAWARYYLPSTLVTLLLVGLGLDNLIGALHSYGLVLVRHLKKL